MFLGFGHFMGLSSRLVVDVGLQVGEATVVDLGLAPVLFVAYDLTIMKDRLLVAAVILAGVLTGVNVAVVNAASHRFSVR